MIDKEKWLKDNSHKSLLLGNLLSPMNPNTGFYVTVNNMDIPEDIFKEEYDCIMKAYYSMMKKMSDHYKTNNNI